MGPSGSHPDRRTDPDDGYSPAYRGCHRSTLQVGRLMDSHHNGLMTVAGMQQAVDRVGLARGWLAAIEAPGTIAGRWDES
ncbi:hypothetical protein DBR10_12115 [Caulobacter sp. HMWF025]|nr:hypothetical protein DBR10_12115 [Caulobacter sp. HMWF025]